MTPEEKQNYINYRLKKADETLQDVLLFANHQRWNACANRLYYSAFYAVSALLLAKGHQTQTHKGVKTLFALHFIKTQKINLVYNDLYTELFDKRQAGDYVDFIDWTEKDILPLIEPTKNLIQTIKNLINEE